MKISLGRTEICMNEILKTEMLTKTYGKSIAVSEVSLTVRQGDIYGLIGKNGAGKTIR